MSKGLFVEEAASESEDSRDHSDLEDPVDGDPVIESIPLIMNTLPLRSTQSLHVIQYPGRPKTRQLDDSVYKASVKEESNYLGVKLPLDTTKFFNGGKSEDWGETIAEQSLEGVLDKTGGGLYVGQIISENGAKKVVLVPVDSTTQLRPTFKYLDEIDQLAISQRRAEAQEANKNTNFQILQTSAKSSSQITNAEGFGNALGESLKHIKKFEEEEWAQLKWKTSEEEETKNIKEWLRHGADGIELTTNTTGAEYINELTKE